MRGFGNKALARPRVAVDGAGDRDADIYDRHAAGLYRQALLTLDDAGMAEQVVAAVIVGECVPPPGAGGGGDDVSYRLAVSAYWRCQELADSPAWRDPRQRQLGPGSVAGCIDPCWLLSGKERGALGLVLFGGLGYVQASRELAISPVDLACLLRSVLPGMTASPLEGRHAS